MLFRRVMAATVLATTAILGTSACSMMSPIASLKEYAPSDGTQGTLGSVKARNVMILTNSKEPSVYGLIGSFVNSTEKDQTFVMSYDDQPAREFTVKAYSVLNLGYSGNPVMQLTLAKPDHTNSWAGAIIKFTLASSTEDILPIELNVPVFDESLPGYQSLIDSLAKAAN